MRGVLVRLLDRYCAECWSFVWPWQPRCGPRHTACKHRADLLTWSRNGFDIEPWDCLFCNRPITEARP